MATNNSTVMLATMILITSLASSASDESAQIEELHAEYLKEETAMFRNMPTRLFPCPPVPPGLVANPLPLGSQAQYECMTLKELHAEYMKKEGHNHRSLFFMYVFDRFLSENIGLPVNEEKFRAAFGEYDFTKKSFGLDGNHTQEVVYLFRYNGDWGFMATVENGLLKKSVILAYGKRLRAAWDIQ